MKPLWFLLALLLLATCGLAQESQSGLHKRKRAKATAPTGSVTQSEAREVLAKLEAAIKKVPRMQGSAPACKIPDSKSPVTRDQIVLEFGRLFEYARPSFTLKLKPMKVTPSILTLVNPAAKAQAIKLAEWGFVARFGRLIAGKAKTVDVELFGDSVGYFIARLSEYTHQPSSRFSPYLNGSQTGP